MPLNSKPNVEQSYMIRPGNLGAGATYVVGGNGNDNPGNVLLDPVISNASATLDYRVGATLVGVVGTRYTLVRAGFVVPLPGYYDQLVFYNVTGSGGNVAPEVAATAPPAKNSSGTTQASTMGQRLTPGSSTFEHAFYVPVVANTASSVTWTIPSQHSAGITITAVRVWSGVPCTSAAGTYLLTSTVGSTPRNVITSFNLETIVAATLTAATLGSGPDLVCAAGETVTITATSNNADLVIGDLVVSIEYTLT